jgi:hypothetical protein
MSDLTTWARQYNSGMLTWDEFLGQLRKFQFRSPQHPDPWDDDLDDEGSVREIDRAVRLTSGQRAEVNEIARDSILGVT